MRLVSMSRIVFMRWSNC